MTPAPFEQPIVIQGDLPKPMLGVLHHAFGGIAPSGTGVVIVNGGAQYRAGAHRLFVQLARHLAAQGHTVLRFDFPGQGDSPGDPVGFEDSAAHIAAAIDCLHALRPAPTKTALLGLCDGASASLLYLDKMHDPRITNLILLNPWVRSEISLARVQVRHYYLQRLLMPDFWRKLVTGGVGWSALLELLGAVNRSRSGKSDKNSSFPDRMLQAWSRFPGSILLIISDMDLIGQEFIQSAITRPAWAENLRHSSLEHHRLQQADHTFSPAAATLDLNALVLAWLSKIPVSNRQ